MMRISNSSPSRVCAVHSVHLRLSNLDVFVHHFTHHKVITGVTCEQEDILHLDRESREERYFTTAQNKKVRVKALFDTKVIHI